MQVFRPLLEGDVEGFINQDAEDLSEALSNLALFLWWSAFALIFGGLDYLEVPELRPFHHTLKTLLFTQTILGFFVGCLLAAIYSPFRRWLKVSLYKWSSQIYAPENVY